MQKLVSLFWLVGVLLAIVSVFVAIPDVNVAAILVVLGILVGFGYDGDATRALTIFVLVLAYPAVGAALGSIPVAGEKLGDIAFNFGLFVAGVAACIMAQRVFGLARDSLNNLMGK